MKKLLIYVFVTLLMFGIVSVLAGTSLAASSAECNSEAATATACSSIDTGALGFRIPSLADILTFTIRAFFVIAGLAALFYMLLGAFAWVTSGGDADAVGAAQQKIQAAVLGLIIIVAVLAIVWTLEQVIFARRICLGLSCPVTLPGLIEPDETSTMCCRCVKDDGTRGDLINAYNLKCEEGIGVPQ